MFWYYCCFSVNSGFCNSNAETKLLQLKNILSVDSLGVESEVGAVVVVGSLNGHSATKVGSPDPTSTVVIEVGSVNGVVVDPGTEAMQQLSSAHPENTSYTSSLEHRYSYIASTIVEVVYIVFLQGYSHWQFYTHSSIYLHIILCSDESAALMFHPTTNKTKMSSACDIFTTHIHDRVIHNVGRDYTLCQYTHISARMPYSHLAMWLPAL